MVAICNMYHRWRERGGSRRSYIHTHRMRSVPVVTSIAVAVLILSSFVCNIIQFGAAVRVRGTFPNSFWKRLVAKNNKRNKTNDTMGQAMRIVQYDRAANERNAVSALQFHKQALEWFRLDDGVMGGRSETQHEAETETGILHFAGTINTDGGGFASIRTRLPPETLSSQQQQQQQQQQQFDAIKLRLRGDGKTYKFFLTDGSRAGPMAKKPSWQMDIPTNHTGATEVWQDVIVPFDKLLPSFAGSKSDDEMKKRYQFDPAEIKEMGVMLSLKLSDGSPNPVSTFGEGIFPFSLLIQSIEPVQLSKSCPS